MSNPPKDQLDVRARLRRAVRRTAREWRQLSAVDSASGYAFRSFIAWCETAFASALSLKQDPALITLKVHPDVSTRLPQTDWPSFLRGTLGESYLAVLVSQRALTLIDNATRRIPELVESQLGVSMTPIASAYLARAAELYLWGFDSEVYVASRAVLETALRERVPDWRVKKIFDLSANERVSLGQRIEAATRYPTILSPPASQRARDIADDANRILHEDLRPQLSNASPLAALRSLDAVLRDMWMKH